jgi:hypothetical protein
MEFKDIPWKDKISEDEQIAVLSRQVSSDQRVTY